MNKPIDITGLVLKTDRLTLRPFRDSDLQDFYEYARVDGVGQMAGWLPHKNIDESRAILDMFIREKKTFALEYEGKVIGSLGIEFYNEQDYPELVELQGREIGYVLSKDYWGQGFMPEAVQAMIHYLFDVEQLDFLICGHFERNARSRRVIEKCGFRYSRTVPFTTEYGTQDQSMEYILYHSKRRLHHVDTQRHASNRNIPAHFEKGCLGGR